MYIFEIERIFFYKMLDYGGALCYNCAVVEKSDYK